MSTAEDVFSIFILKSNPSVLGSAEAYLRNRNWDVNSATSLREAMAFLIKHQPQFVLISVDHPNQKVRALPKLLAQAFQCQVIPMAEKASLAATKSLIEMNANYYLNAPVSGPGIQRLILKIRKDEETKDSTSNSKVGISKNTAAGANDQVHLSGSLDSARASLNQLLALEKESNDSGSPITQEGMGGKDGVAYWGGAADSQQKGTDVPSAGPAIKNGPAYKPKQETQRADESFAEYAERMRTMAESNAGWESSTPKKSNLAYMPTHEPSGKAGDFSSSGMEGTSDWGHGTPRGPHNASMEGLDVEKSPKKSAKFIRDLTKEDLSKKPLIQQGTQSALNQASNIPEEIEEGRLQNIDKASNVACITVDSPSFKGYLVCALGKNRTIDLSFIETIRHRLSEFLRINGETISEKDSLLLRIQEVHFDEWALNQAEFLRKSIHNDDEVAVAFFPTADIEPPVEISPSEKMLQMELKELKEDTALEFDLYVFLPENQKYLLYTPQGMVFYTAQKGRLKDKGVTHMHLRKDSLGQVKKYRAQNFLNDKIKEFKNKKH